MEYLFVLFIINFYLMSINAVVDPQIGFYGFPIPEEAFERYGPNDFYENDGFRKYSYDYGVSDPHTGDHKKVWEEAYGNGVKGGYSLIDPDGTERVVEYVADDINGFNAVVKRFGHAKHPFLYTKPYPLVPPVVPVIVPYKNYYNPIYRNEPYARAYSYQNIEQYH